VWLHRQEISGENIGPEADYPDLCCFQIFSVPPGSCRMVHKMIPRLLSVKTFVTNYCSLDFDCCEDSHCSVYAVTALKATA